MSNTLQSDYSVSQLAKIMHIRPNAVKQLISSGRLVGYDASLPGAKRKTLRVTPESLEAFRNLQSATATPQPRQKKRSTAVEVPRTFYK